MSPVGTPLGGDRWDSSAISVGGQVGARFLFICPPGGFNSFLWGTDTYTTGSSVCTAAVHVGLITFAAGGSVVIEIRPGQDSYVGSERNGVTSADQGAWDRSFVFLGAPPGTPAPSESPTSPAPSATGKDLSGELIQAGVLKICTSFGRPRFAEFDAQGQPGGVDVEIGLALADELALAPELVDTLFDELIPAVTGGDCDISIGGQFITGGRLEQIAMIPYREGAPHVIVAPGNPLGIGQLTDLCGRRFAVVAATVYVDLVRGVGDFVGEGVDEQCASSGREAVDVLEFDDQQAAEEALADGEADAYAGNDFVTVERPTEFELSFELPPFRNGIGLRLTATTLDASLRAALRAIIADGSYLEILEKHDAEGVRLTIEP